MISISLTICLLSLNKQTSKYDNIMLMRDFNLTVENKNLEVFMSTFDLECTIKKPIRFQSIHLNCTTNKKEKNFSKL